MPMKPQQVSPSADPAVVALMEFIGARSAVASSFQTWEVQFLVCYLAPAHQLSQAGGREPSPDASRVDATPVGGRRAG